MSVRVSRSRKAGRPFAVGRPRMGVKVLVLQPALRRRPRVSYDERIAREPELKGAETTALSVVREARKLAAVQAKRRLVVLKELPEVLLDGFGGRAKSRKRRK